MLAQKFCQVVLACTCLLLGGAFSPVSGINPVSLSSPDGDLTVVFELKTNPQPYLPGQRAYYRVSFKGSPILRDSPLGLDFLGAPPLDRDFTVLKVDRRQHDSTWQNPLGPQRRVRDHYHEMTVALQENQAPRRRVDLVFRAYNEGIAFRYFLPKQEAFNRFTIAAENTGFYFSDDAVTYAADLGRYNGAQQSEFRRTAMSQIRPYSIIGLPLLIEMKKDLWVALLEADLRDYAGMYLGGVPGTPHALQSKLSLVPPLDTVLLPLYLEAADNLSDARELTQLSKQFLFPISGASGRTATVDQVVITAPPKATPWRVVQVNSRLGGLIESNYLILNLSEPSVLADTSWIKPGKVAWEWWSGSFARQVNFRPGMNTATMKHYVDFAADHHLEYMLIDADWSPLSDITRPVRAVDLPAILSHAERRGVKIMLWVPWTAVVKQMDVAFPLYERWGVAGVKIDFMNRDDQEMVNLYEKMLRKAAAHRLVVNFHGAYKPTGLQRTYPNLLTLEAVLGMEHSKVGDRITPEHDVTLPFTRMLAGPMDYTPGSFRNATRAQFKARLVEPMSQGTRAHQLAMYVVYESPLVMLSDYPEAYRNQPGLDFLIRVPTVWDTTKVLHGEVGKYITMARMKGETWYLGSMTNWDARDLEIPLSFLGAGEYEARIYADGPKAHEDATDLTVSKRRVKACDRLNIHLAPGGGFAASFEPVAR